MFVFRQKSKTRMWVWQTAILCLIINVSVTGFVFGQITKAEQGLVQSLNDAWGALQNASPTRLSPGQSQKLVELTSVKFSESLRETKSRANKAGWDVSGSIGASIVNIEFGDEQQAEIGESRNFPGGSVEGKIVINKSSQSLRIEFAVGSSNQTMNYAGVPVKMETVFAREYFFKSDAELAVAYEALSNQAPKATSTLTKNILDIVSGEKAMTEFGDNLGHMPGLADRARDAIGNCIVVRDSQGSRLTRQVPGIAQQVSFMKHSDRQQNDPPDTEKVHFTIGRGYGVKVDVAEMAETSGALVFIAPKDSKLRFPLPEFGGQIKREETFDPNNPDHQMMYKAMANVINNNDTTTTLELAAKDAGVLDDLKMIGLSLKILEQYGRSQIDLFPERLQANGVIISYHPGLVESPLEYVDALRELTRQFDTGGKNSFAIQTGCKQHQLQAVSLTQVLSDPAAKEIPLTRLLGYRSERDGQMYLFGEDINGQPRVSLDVLVAAVKSIMEHKDSYALISLDPVPPDAGGPQRVRIEGIHASLRNTELVKILIDADYLMKSIALNPSTVTGFSTYFDLVGESKKDNPTGVRFWLQPAVPVAGDVRCNEEGQSETAIFHSDAWIQTETAMFNTLGQLSTKEPDELAATAANEFNAHFDDLAQQHPEFQRLLGAFDACKLVRIWQLKKVQHETITKLLERTPAEIEIPVAYPALMSSPITHAGSNQIFVISGGATTTQNLSLDHFVDGADDLSQLRPGKPFNFNMPLVRQLDPSHLAQEQSILESNKGLSALSAKDYVRARSHFENVLQQVPNRVRAKLMLAYCHVHLDENELAKKLVAAVEPVEAYDRALRGFLLARVDQDAEARTESTKALKLRNDDPEILLLVARTMFVLQDYSESERFVLKCLAANPLNQDAIGLWNSLGQVHRLGPERAKKIARMLKVLPAKWLDDFSDAFQLVQYQQFDQAIPLLEDLVKEVQESGNSFAKETFFEERCIVQLAIAYSGSESWSKIIAGKNHPPQAIDERWQRRRELIDRFVSLHPEWASTKLVQAMASQPDEPGFAESKRSFRRAMRSGAKLPEIDPLLSEFGDIDGSEEFITHLGVAIWQKLEDKNSPEANLIIDNVAKRLSPELLAGRLSKMEAWASLDQIKRELATADTSVSFVDHFFVDLFMAAWLKNAIDRGDRETAAGIVNSYYEFCKRVEVDSARRNMQAIWLFGLLGPLLDSEVERNRVRYGPLNDQRLDTFYEKARGGQIDVAALKSLLNTMEAEVDESNTERISLIEGFPKLFARDVLLAKDGFYGSASATIADLRRSIESAEQSDKEDVIAQLDQLESGIPGSVGRHAFALVRQNGDMESSQAWLDARLIIVQEKLEQARPIIESADSSLDFTMLKFFWETTAKSMDVVSQQQASPSLAPIFLALIDEIKLRQMDEYRARDWSKWK